MIALPITAQQPPKLFAIRNATIHTLAGEPIEQGTVLIRDGLIAGVGRKLGIPRGAEIIDARGLHVYPGMIDAYSQLGLREVRSVRATVDTSEKGNFNPHLEAITAVHPSSEHIPVTRANGITHAVVTMSASGSSLMPGQASIIHLDGWTWEEMRIEAGQAVQVNWPTIRLRPANRSGPPRGGSSVPSTFKEAKKQYDARVAELDKWIESARHYAKANPSQTDHRLAALVPVIESQKPLLIVANRARAIRDAIAFTEKHNVKLILAGVAEAWKVIDLLKEKKVPVILQLVERLPGHQDDPYDHPFALAAELHSGGVPFAFATFGADKSRLLPYQAAVASAYGLPKEEALRAVTLYPARILSIDDRFGTIEEGKVANLIVTTGDPLEIQTETKHLFIRGQLTPTTNKHQRLYEKYRSRPRGQQAR